MAVATAAIIHRRGHSLNRHFRCPAASQALATMDTAADAVAGRSDGLLFSSASTGASISGGRAGFSAEGALGEFLIVALNFP